MSTFNPDVPCRVHDKLNDKILNWRPEWAANYRQYADDFGDGVIEWIEDVRIESNRGQGWLPNGRMFLIDNHPATAMRNCDIDPAKNPYTRIAPPPIAPTTKPTTAPAAH